MTTPAAFARAPRLDVALLLLRLVLGVVFIVHGGQKLFVFGHGGIVGMFGHMGIPMPAVSAWVVPVVEFFGGIAVLIGAFTWVAAALLAIDMLGAMAFVHLKNGFFNPNGFEFPLTVFTVALALAIAGAGGWSVDAAVRRRRVSPS